MIQIPDRNITSSYCPVGEINCASCYNRGFCVCKKIDSSNEKETIQYDSDSTDWKRNNFMVKPWA